MQNKFENQLNEIIILLNRIAVISSQKFEKFALENEIENDRMITRKEAASLCEVSARTIIRWEESAGITGTYIGGNVRYSEAEVKKYTKRNKLKKK